MFWLNAPAPIEETESGTYSLVKLGNSPKPYDPIDVNESGSVNSAMLDPLKQLEPMLTSEFGNAMDDSFEHFLKDPLSSEDIPSGMSIFVRLIHPDKALAPNDV